MHTTRWSTVGAAWGLLGVAVVFTGGVVSTGHHVLSLDWASLSPLHWAMLALWLAFMAYGKGYRGMQRSYIPAVLARARSLREEPRWWAQLLAPLYCMRMVAAPWRTLGFTWGFVLVIVGLVVGVRHLPAPWREGVDLGVSLGLAWGLVVLLRGAHGVLASPANHESQEQQGHEREPAQGG